MTVKVQMKKVPLSFMISRESDMRFPVLLNTLNELKKRDKM